MEHAQFGEQIVRRENADHEWEVCAEDDVDAQVAMGIKKYKKDTREANGPKRIATEITRSPRNNEIGEELGLGTGDAAGDALAEGLNNTSDTETTRISATAFKSRMGELGLSVEDAKARFKGTDRSE